MEPLMLWILKSREWKCNWKILQGLYVSKGEFPSFFNLPSFCLCFPWIWNTVSHQIRTDGLTEWILVIILWLKVICWFITSYWLTMKDTQIRNNIIKSWIIYVLGIFLQRLTVYSSHISNTCLDCIIILFNFTIP